MSETSKDQLTAFEKIADQQVQKLNILLLPLRLVLTHLYGTVDNLFNGSRLSGENPPRPLVAFDLASRLSYLMPLFNRCPVDQIGASALDVLNAVDWITVDPDIRYLINYGHLCELMPEVHRDYYEISGSIPLFYLKHSTDEFARSEIKDLFLTSLATPFFIRNRFIPEEVFDVQAAKTDGTFDMRLFFSTIRKYFSHYLNYSFEVPIFTNKGYHDSLNATVEEFIRFRSVWTAIADYCLGMADAFTRLIKRTNATNNYNLVSEVWEWTAPVMKADLLTDLVIKIGGISSKSFNAFMQIFSVDPKANRTKHVGDGFYPPITILKNSYMFNPNILQMMLSSRNIPYAMNKLDKALFDNSLSHEMEPALVEAASLILSQIPGTILRKNFKWQHGEIDLLAYSPAENVALHFQAKAAIPAQGARMVQQMEARIIEGIDQLARFQMLKSETQDEILSTALALKIKDARIQDMLLSRVNFGTHRVWSRMDRCVPVNLSLLQAAVDVVSKEQDTNRLQRLPAVAAQLLDDYCAETFEGWDYQQFTVGSTAISFPTPIFNELKMERLRVISYPRATDTVVSATDET